ncbi:extracellular ribonuclease LE, partial [Tanacetum coccineum]
SSNPLPNSSLNYLSSLQRAPPPPPQVTSYKLAVQWPPGVCSGKSGVTCQIIPVPTEFTIHGLWPHPNGAASNETFDANKLDLGDLCGKVGSREISLEAMDLFGISLEAMDLFGISLEVEVGSCREWDQECRCPRDQSLPLGEELERVNQRTQCREELELADEAFSLIFESKESFVRKRDHYVIQKKKFI